MAGPASPVALSDVCVVIPTYNERDNVVRLAESLRRLSPGLRIIVVDDESPDGTGPLAEEAAARLAPMRVIRRQGKGGRGSAVLAGFAAGLAEPGVRALVEMDADFSHDPAELPETVARLDAADVVIRSRYQPGSRIVDWSLQRRVFSRAANAFARRVLRVTLSDYTNGYRVYSRAAAEAIEPAKIDSTGYIVLSEVAVQLHAKSFRFLELPSVFVNRRRGESNLGWREISSAVRGILRLAARGG
jgi:dolichol-phosphate mannosyltransferase